jgi:hypothetical protein
MAGITFIIRRHKSTGEKNSWSKRNVTTSCYTTSLIVDIQLGTPTQQGVSFRPLERLTSMMAMMIKEEEKSRANG